MGSWRYGSVSDAVDAISDGEPPWVGDMTDRQFADLVVAYEREPLAVAAGAAAAEAHANHAAAARSTPLSPGPSGAGSAGPPVSKPASPTRSPTSRPPCSNP